MANKIPQCTGCGGSGHYAINCLVTARTVPKARKKYIKPESDKARERRLQVREEWFEQNPANAMPGHWYCYLNRLSYDCWYVLDRQQIEDNGLEHVIPKVKSRDLKFEVANLKVACPPCNKVKGSNRLERLAELYPGWNGPLA